MESKWFQMSCSYSMMSLENFKFYKELLKASMDALKKNQLYHKPQTNFLISKYSNFKNHMKPKTIII